MKGQRGRRGTRPLRRGAVAAALAVALALALAPAALAHARLTASSPAAGAVLATAPTQVVLRFDDAVLSAPGAAAVRHGGGSVLAGEERSSGRVVTIPLRAGLADGDYSVRWRVLGDDGHVLEGVFAFAVGAGREAPAPQLALLGAGPRWGYVLGRWLLLAGVLLALGGLVFRAAVLRGEGRGRRPEDGELLVAVSASFAVALAGAALSLVSVPDALHTRFGQAAVAAIAAAAAGAALAEVARSTGRWVLASAPAAVALAACVVAGGHALDPPAGLRPLKAAVDVAHLGAAAIWVGGLAQVALLVPRLPQGERRPALRRFGVLAAGALAVLAATGIGRAAFGLATVPQAWDTGYGRALLVKTGLLLAAVAVAGLAARRGTAGTGNALVAEVALVVGIVVAVAVLADLRPGRDSARAATAGAGGQKAGSVAKAPPSLPPLDAVTLARQEGDDALAIAIRALGTSRLQLTATVTGPDGRGVDGLDLRLGADAAPAPTLACGPGCYTVTVPAPASPRRITVALGGTPRPALELPGWPPAPADALVRRATAAFRALRSLRTSETLASSATTGQRSQQRVVAPDRFAYDIPGGAAGVVIGTRRWDRLPGERQWTASPATRLSLPAPLWGGTVTNAFDLGPATLDGRAVRVVTFLDRRLPAWFTAWVDPATARTLQVRMTTAAHFMLDRYSAFDEPLAIEPPPAAEVKP